MTRLGVPDINLNQLRADQLALGAQLTQQVENPLFGKVPASSSLGGRSLAAQQLLRPFPRFTTVTLYRSNTGGSTYHSLQCRIERRFARGLTFTVAYTFSKLIDDAGAVFDAAILTGPVAAYQVADTFNRRLEKDASTGHIPHILPSGFIYELPFGEGWRIGGILRAQSGSPLPVTQAINYNAAFSFGIQRPNRLRDPNISGCDRKHRPLVRHGCIFHSPAVYDRQQFALQHVRLRNYHAGGRTRASLNWL